MPIATGKTGLAPVSVVLAAHAFDVHTVAAHRANWDTAYDNLWDTNVLASLPPGVGFTTLLDGTDGTLTMTTAGTWSLSWLVRHAGTDATYVGFFGDSLGAVSSEYLSQLNGGDATAAAVLGLPSGAQAAGQVTTQSVGAGTDTATVFLFATRLG